MLSSTRQEPRRASTFIPMPLKSPKFSAIAASLNNLGPGLGDVFSNYTLLETFPKWVCITGMVLGRLEIFALLVLFTRAFWQE